MVSTSIEESDFAPEPLDLVEQVLMDEDLVFEREEEAEIHLGLKGQYCDLHGCFSARPEFDAIVFTLTFDLRSPKDRRAQIAETVALANERLWLGHFDLWSDEGAIVYRHTLPLLDRTNVERGEIVAVLSAGVEACDRFIPAFNFVLWAGKSPREAVEAAAFETTGQA